MTFEELTLEILKTLIPKSGVREWEDEQHRTDVTFAAMQMAATILNAANGGDPVANENYIKHGTTIVFGSEVGDDVAWSSESIADAAGRQSSLHDQGAEGTARPLVWQYRIHTQAQATPTVNNLCEMYLKTSDGTHPDNDDGVSDAAVSASNKLKNLTMLQSPVVDEAAANIEYVSRGMVAIPHRHFGVVMWNAMGSTVTADAAETKAHFTPMYEQQQA